MKTQSLDLRDLLPAELLEPQPSQPQLTAVAQTLVLQRTSCVCGTSFLAPQGVMVEHQTPQGSTKVWQRRELRLDIPRRTKTIDISIEACPRCWRNN